jgi:hypothetical protein
MPGIHHYCVIVLLLIALNSASQVDSSALNSRKKAGISLPLLPQNFYSRQLSFFCRNELWMEKQLPLKVFFRLGSKEYVDHLERKPGTAANRISF